MNTKLHNVVSALFLGAFLLVGSRVSSIAQTQAVNMGDGTVTGTITTSGSVTTGDLYTSNGGYIHYMIGPAGGTIQGNSPDLGQIYGYISAGSNWQYTYYSDTLGTTEVIVEIGNGYVNVYGTAWYDDQTVYMVVHAQNGLKTTTITVVNSVNFSINSLISHSRYGDNDASIAMVFFNFGETGGIYDIGDLNPTKRAL